MARYRELRGLLHSGRMVRPESSDPAVLLHGVVAADGSEALLAHVQLDESTHNRGVSVRVPALDPTSSYALAWEGPVDLKRVSKSADLPVDGPDRGPPPHRRRSRHARVLAAATASRDRDTGAADAAPELSRQGRV